MDQLLINQKYEQIALKYNPNTENENKEELQNLKENYAFLYPFSQFLMIRRIACVNLWTYCLFIDGTQ